MAQVYCDRDVNSVFGKLLGSAFAALPLPLQQLHDARRVKLFTGTCDVQRGANWLSKCIGWLAGLPSSATQIPVSVEIVARNGIETWKRNFDGHRMPSRLSAKGPFLQEQLGPITFLFSLRVVSNAIEWRIHRAMFLFVPLPRKWFAQVQASESLHNNRYTFDVSATLPLIGLLVAYRGWLQEK